MAYDEDLADRIRVSLEAESGITEKRMFGGLAFLVNGNMAVAAGSRGALMVRVPAADTETLLGDPHVVPMVMRGRELTGWIEVVSEGLADESELSRWVSLGVAHARTLPGK